MESSVSPLPSLCIRTHRTPLPWCECWQVPCRGEPRTWGGLGSSVPVLPLPGKAQQRPGRGLRGPRSRSAGPARGPSQARPESARDSGPGQAHSQGRGPDEETRQVYSSWSAAAGAASGASQQESTGRTPSPGLAGRFPTRAFSVLLKGAACGGEIPPPGRRPRPPAPLGCELSDSILSPAGDSVPSTAAREYFPLCGPLRVPGGNNVTFTGSARDPSLPVH